MLQIPHGRRAHGTPWGRIGDLVAWRWVIPALLLMLNAIGCNALQKKHDNPVLIEAPRRVTRIEPDPDPEAETQVADKSKPSDIEQVNVTSLPSGSGFKVDPWEGWEDDTAIYNSKVAATVNGAPILNGDVLDRYSGYLIGLRENVRKNKGTPEDYAKIREMLVQRDLSSHVQRRLLVESMRTSLKPDQIKALNSHLDGVFEKEVEKLKRELKVSTRTELELELNKKGTTLQNYKDSFTTERMAMEFVAIKMDKAEHIDRMDLLAYYQSHLADYEIPAKVEWEQIQVSYTDKATKSKAMEKLTSAMRDLQSGVPFATVAKKYSDGPSAKDGGKWEPMEAGSLTDTKLEKMLFDMPIGKLSSVHEGPSELQVVRVTARHDAGRVPFGDVQEDIRQKLELDQNKKRPEKLFKKLMSEAVIETKYDLKQQDSEEKPESEQTTVN